MQKNRLIFILVYPFLLFFNAFPRISIKVLPRILYVLLFYIIGYRKKIVQQNLERCFSNDIDIQKATKQYYKHLASLIVEPLLTLGLSKSYLNKRVQVNTDLIDKLHNEGKSVFIVMGHCGNWEWLSTVAPLKSPFRPSIVYKKLSNPFFERYINQSRSKYGTDCVEMTHVGRYVMAKLINKEQFIMSFVADQIPSHENCSIVNFFSTPHYFFNGYCKLAARGNIAIVYFKSWVKNGVYFYEPILLKDANEAIEQSLLVERFVEQLEINIMEQPFNWLWSHRRWKRMPKN